MKKLKKLIQMTFRSKWFLLRILCFWWFGFWMSELFKSRVWNWEFWVVFAPIIVGTIAAWEEGREESVRIFKEEARLQLDTLFGVLDDKIKNFNKFLDHQADLLDQQMSSFMTQNIKDHLKHKKEAANG